MYVCLFDNSLFLCKLLKTVRGFPFWWTAPNLILNILFQRIIVHRIEES